MFSRSCVTIGGSNTGYTLNLFGESVTYTTTLIRVLKARNLDCYYKKGPCYFFITLGKQGAHEAIVNMHVPSRYSASEVKLFYDTRINYRTNKQLKHSIAPANITSLGSQRRVILSYYIQNLKADTDYSFLVEI